MPKIYDLTGKRFGALTVIEKSAKRSSGSIMWVCRCDCGNITTVNGRDLRVGHTKSCGCLYRGRKPTHGMAKTRLYYIWQHMLGRCNRKTDNSYERYGGRGITVCDEWLDFQAFADWAFNNGYEEHLTIDRIDNNSGYSPENCRWATYKQQSNNRRYCTIYEKDGKKQNLTQWCEELNLNYETVRSRIKKHGWSFERAISEPVHTKNRNMRHRQESR